MIEDRAIVHVEDLAQEQQYVERTSPGMIDAVELGGVRTLLLVPMMKEAELVGAFAVSRCEVRLLPVSRSNWSRTSPPKQSSPSRTRGCSMN